MLPALGSEHINTMALAETGTWRCTTCGGINPLGDSVCMWSHLEAQIALLHELRAVLRRIARDLR